MKRISFPSLMPLLLLIALPLPAQAATETTGYALDLTPTWMGLAALAVFIIAYFFVISEEFLHLRKSKPVMVAAGIIWTLVGIGYAQVGDSAFAAAAIRENLLEYGELLLFLLAAMTFINTMGERQVFAALRTWLISRDYSLRTIFWITGLLAFLISPFADNLTTALVMGAVVLAVAADNKRFVVVAMINIVVAANAGGAFSPFGDITTLMVWQKGVIQFHEFFDLFFPALVNWLVPAILMSITVPREKPRTTEEAVHIRYGGMVVIGLFLLTIAMAVTIHIFLGLPPVLGMMSGLGLLKIHGYFIRRHELHHRPAYLGEQDDFTLDGDHEHLLRYYKPKQHPFDVYISMKRAEWDTLMFFYGVVLCVGGLGTAGYLALASQGMYVGLGPTGANVLVGLLSAIVDNIPVMYAVLTMHPMMSHGQWLLVTMTAGVGGSLLSIGSAAGVALMGQARGVYTFFSHLKWSWAVALGYAASIWVHFIINASLINLPPK